MRQERSQRRTWRHLLGLEGAGSERRKRLLIRVGIAGVALVGLVLLPGYLATRPAFLERYARMGGAFETWSDSAHAKVPCQRCHVAPGFVAQRTYDAKMLGEFYLSIVMPSREPELFRKPSNAACSSCHIDLRTVSPRGDLNIPHRAHVSVLRLDCVKCHNYLVHKASPEGKHVPRMADCLRCHDGKTAKSQCSACHTDKNEPLTHRAADWLVVHPSRADAKGADCNRCHKWTARWCSNCHEQRPRSHGNDWRSRHGDRVAVRRNCEACHAAPFCVRCHGEVPGLNFDPALKPVTR